MLQNWSHFEAEEGRGLLRAASMFISVAMIYLTHNLVATCHNALQKRDEQENTKNREGIDANELASQNNGVCRGAGRAGFRAGHRLGAG